MADRQTWWRASARLTALGMGAIACALLFAGCEGDPASPDADVRRGTVIFHRDGPSLRYPDTVQAGEPFSLHVTTFGNGCVSGHETRVRTKEEDRVSIEPFDQVAGSVCADLLKSIDHTAEVTLPIPGQAVLEFVGLEEPVDTVVRLRRVVIVE